MCQVTQTPAAYSHFNMSHWLKVKAERSRLGLTNQRQRGPGEPHALNGRDVVDTRNGQRFHVSQVYRDWYQGWFLVALLQCDQGPRTCVVDNISCQDDSILEQLAAFKTHFQALS